MNDVVEIKKNTDQKGQVPKGKKILIAGASGRIGHAVALEAVKENEVWGVARFTNPKLKKKLEDAGIKCVVKDLADWDVEAIKKALEDLPDDFNILIDETLGAFITPALYERYPDAEALVATTTGQNYIGYTEPYLRGEKIFRWDESLRQPLSYYGKYGMNKAAIEYFAHHYCVTKKIPTVILRYECPFITDWSLHKPGMEAWLKHLLENKEFVVPRNIIGRPYPFIHVKDAAIATLEASSLASIPPNIFNIAGYNPYTIREVLEIMAQVFGREVKYREVIASNILDYGGGMMEFHSMKDVISLTGGYNHPFIYVLDKMKKYLSEPKISFREMVEEIKANGTYKPLCENNQS